MITFILGGVKSGKSMLAQCTARYLSETGGGNLFYLATMVPMDSEDHKRIERHRADRSEWGFITIEEPYYLLNAFSHIKGEDVVLLDSVTSYVQNILFADNDIVNQISLEDVFLQMKLISHKIKHTVIVSDYIFSDANAYTINTNRYKELLGKVHREIAKFSDCVIECAFSNLKFQKNTLGFNFEPILKEYYSLTSHLEYSEL